MTEQWRGDPKEIELGQLIEKDVAEKRRRYIEQQLAEQILRDSQKSFLSVFEALKASQNLKLALIPPKPKKPSRLKKLLARLGGHRDGGAVIRPVTSTDDSTD